MKLLYAARIARFELLRSITMLARNVNKWTPNEDAKLHRLICDVNSTLDKRMTGWVGDSIADLSIAIFADADFAGCGVTYEIDLWMPRACSGQACSISHCWR